MLVASDHARSCSCGTALATMISPAASQPLSTLDANGYTMSAVGGEDGELGQRHGVVPVVVLARRLVALHPFEAGQRELDPRRCLLATDQLEIAGGERRPQVHPDVGRRRVLGAAGSGSGRRRCCRTAVRCSARPSPRTSARCRRRSARGSRSPPGGRAEPSAGVRVRARARVAARTRMRRTVRSFRFDRSLDAGPGDALDDVALHREEQDDHRQHDDGGAGQ